MKKNVGALLLAACLCLPIAGASAAVVKSAFDVNAEGWETGNIARLQAPPFFAVDTTVFDPVTYDAVNQRLQSLDIHPWNTFRSSPAYAGNRSAFFGGSISYDLQDTQSDPGVSWPNIAILARSGAMIFIPTTAPSTSSLTHYDFALDSSAPWQKLLGGLLPVQASDADIRAVLADVAGIWINADWKTGDASGNDDARLDNVCLRDANSSCSVNQLPAPGTLALLGIGVGLLGLRGRLRRSL